MYSIVFFSTQWGSKHGGINSFNNDLTIGFSNILPRERFKIVCVVTEMEQNDVNEAEEYNIELVKVKSLQNPLKIFEKIHKHDDKILLWIGHDVKTGFCALETSDYYRKVTAQPTRVAVFHHMDYSEYEHLKGKSAEEVDAKDKEQIDVLSRADLVLAVGPKLRESAEDKLEIGNSKDKPVIEVIPGIHQEIMRNDLHRFNCISYGRFGDDDNIIKQGKLAIASFCAFSSTEKLKNSHLYLFGVDQSQIGEIKKVRKEFGHHVENIHPFEFKPRKDIFELLGNQSVSMMLSLREGFGLTGWEAISAGVPLILSENSGLYMFLNAVLPLRYKQAIYPVDILGDEDGEVNPTDLANVQIQLGIIYQDREYANEKALELKQYLLEQGYTWEQAARKILRECELISSISRFEFEENYHSELITYLQYLLENQGYETEILEYLKHSGDILAEKDGRKFYISIAEFLSIYSDDYDEYMGTQLSQLEHQRVMHKADEVWFYVLGGNQDEGYQQYLVDIASSFIKCPFTLLQTEDILTFQEKKTHKELFEILDL